MFRICYLTRDLKIKFADFHIVWVSRLGGLAPIPYGKFDIQEDCFLLDYIMPDGKHLNFAPFEINETELSFYNVAWAHWMLLFPYVDFTFCRRKNETFTFAL